MTNKQRATLSNILSDLGKLVFAGLVIGKFVSTVAIPNTVFIFGIISSILCFIAAIAINKE